MSRMIAALLATVASVFPAVAWACLGTALPPPPATGTLLMPASVMQPSQSGDIAGFNLQNLSGTASVGYLTIGMAFKQGDAPVSGYIYRARAADGSTVPVQFDPLAYWPDGSVRFAALSVSANLCATSQMQWMLFKQIGTRSGPLTWPNPTLTVTLNFTSGPYTGTKTIDLGTPAQTSTDTWQNGWLVVQRRVDVVVPGGDGTLHVTADITAMDSLHPQTAADVQFNRDLTHVITCPVVNYNVQCPAALAPITYTATITLNGAQTNVGSVSQYQYQDWHRIVGQNYFGVTGPAGPAINVQFDLGYLEHAGAVLSYSRTAGVQNGAGSIGIDGAALNVFDAAASAMGATGFGSPLNPNGVHQDMPAVGGRPDIGWTTTYAAAWLMTGDSRAETMTLAWGDAGGAVPWNYRDTVSGHWVTPAINTGIWTDYRGVVNLANLVCGPSVCGWTPEMAHQPDLAYPAYLMTASRWYHDRLMAQAAFSEDAVLAGSGGFRTAFGTVPASDIVLDGPQMRSGAWDLREINAAAKYGKSGTFEQQYFAGAVADNWAWLQSQESSWASIEGELAGYDFGALEEPPTGGPPNNVMAWWEWDFLNGIVALASSQGDAGATQYLGWVKQWQTNRFLAADFWPYSGCTADWVISDNSGNLLTRWSDVQSASVAAGYATNSAAWLFPDGYYCPIARGALGAALTVQPGDAALTQALNWLNANGPASVQSSWQHNDPTWNVVPIQP